MKTLYGLLEYGDEYMIEGDPIVYTKLVRKGEETEEQRMTVVIRK